MILLSSFGQIFHNIPAPETEFTVINSSDQFQAMVSLH